MHIHVYVSGNFLLRKCKFYSSKKETVAKRNNVFVYIFVSQCVGGSKGLAGV